MLFGRLVVVKCLRVLPYPALDGVRPGNAPKPAAVVYKKSKHHYGSIYCTAWNPAGNLIATGSNDKTVKLLKFDPDLLEDAVSSRSSVFIDCWLFFRVFRREMTIATWMSSLNVFRARNLRSILAC